MAYDPSEHWDVITEGELVQGQHVKFEGGGPWYNSTGSGIYVGTWAQYGDGILRHYFAVGEINGHWQELFGLPVSNFVNGKARQS